MVNGNYQLPFTIYQKTEGTMSSLSAITQQIIKQMPPQARFRPEDAQVITGRRDLLLGLEDGLVAGFYDTLFAHGETRAIFSDSERPDREQTLRNWWRRTVSGPFDAQYWDWQVLVGLVHVKRKVKNPMMIAMWGWILNFLRQEAARHLPQDQADELISAITRLSATTQGLTAESYLEHYIKALSDATGFESALLDRMIASEVDDLLAAQR
jgi:hypothetical protein